MTDAVELNTVWKHSNSPPPLSFTTKTTSSKVGLSDLLSFSTRGHD